METGGLLVACATMMSVSKADSIVIILIYNAVFILHFESRNSIRFDTLRIKIHRLHKPLHNEVNRVIAKPTIIPF